MAVGDFMRATGGKSAGVRAVPAAVPGIQAVPEVWR